jgi:hypothetical protein
MGTLSRLLMFPDFNQVTEFEGRNSNDEKTRMASFHKSEGKAIRLWFFG